jgi:hypothetical protein
LSTTPLQCSNACGCHLPAYSSRPRFVSNACCCQHQVLMHGMHLDSDARHQWMSVGCACCLLHGVIGVCAAGWWRCCRWWPAVDAMACIHGCDTMADCGMYLLLAAWAVCVGAAGWWRCCRWWRLCCTRSSGWPYW